MGTVFSERSPNTIWADLKEAWPAPGGIPGGWRGVGEGIPLVFGCTWPWPRGAPSQERGGRPFVRAAEISTGAQDRSRSSRR